jgi:hypothetical protein
LRHYNWKNKLVILSFNLKTNFMKFNPIYLLALLPLTQSCSKETPPPTPITAKVNFIFKFDSTQARLNAIGQPSIIPAGNAAQSPKFNSMSAHYLELAPIATTALGAGAVLYHAPEVTTGGATAIDFSKSKFAGNNEIFLSVPVTNFASGSYTWLRVSLAYQNYTIKVTGFGQTIDATVASFIGYNTYIPSYKIKDSTQIVNANKAQGYWAAEGSFLGFGAVQSGQAPAGATTVPNPIFATSPVPAGSCVVTGQFASPLVITGKETTDINVVVSLSINKSFEWRDITPNGQYNPQDGDQVVDMGIRGLIPIKL